MRFRQPSLVRLHRSRTRGVDRSWVEGGDPSDDLKSFLDGWSAIQQSGVAQDIDGRLRRFDGEYRWFMFQPSFTDEAGRARWCWLGSRADESTVTDGRLRRLFDMLPWQAGFLNTAGVLEFTNQQSLKDFNMTARELEQWTQSGIIHVDDHENVVRNTQALLNTGQMMDYQFGMLYPNGAYRWTRAQCVPVRDAQGNVVRYVTFQVDVDDLKRAEEVLAAEVEMLERLGRGEPVGEVLVALSRHVEELCNGGVCHILLIAAGATRTRWRSQPRPPLSSESCLPTLDGSDPSGPR